MNSVRARFGVRFLFAIASCMMLRFKAIRKYCYMILLLSIVLPISTTTCVAQLEIDGWLESTTWTDVTGKYKIEATFVRIDQQNVIFKKSDGKEISVPLSKLNEESRQRATEASKKKGAASPGPSAKLTSPATPASIPSASSSSSAIAIPAKLEAKAFVEFIVQQAKDGRPIVIWDAMPASFQRDINQVVKLAADKVDPSLVRPVTKTLADVVKVLRTKKNFVLNTPMLQSFLTDKQLANKLYDPAVDLVEAYIPSDLLDPKNLSKGDLRPQLEGYLNRLTQKAKTLQEAVPKDSSAYEVVASTSWENFKFDLESSSGDSATLIVKGANAPEQRVELVRFEDRWVPKEMVADWGKNIEMAKQQLGKITPQEMAQAKQSMMMPLSIVGGIVNGLQQANDQASFDEAVAGVMAMIPMGGGMGMPGMQPGMPMPELKPPAQ